MKMAKKLLALVLTGVMAMSVLTGCGSTASRQAAGKLEGMLKEANPNATVEVGSEELANKAIEAATTDDGKFETNAKKNIKAALKEGTMTSTSGTPTSKPRVRIRLTRLRQSPMRF